MAALNARGLMRAGDAVTQRPSFGATLDARIVLKTLESKQVKPGVWA